MSYNFKSKKTAETLRDASEWLEELDGLGFGRPSERSIDSTTSGTLQPSVVTAIVFEDIAAAVYPSEEDTNETWDDPARPGRTVQFPPGMFMYGKGKAYINKPVWANYTENDENGNPGMEQAGLFAETEFYWGEQGGAPSDSNNPFMENGVIAIEVFNWRKETIQAGTIIQLGHDGSKYFVLGETKPKARVKFVISNRNPILEKMDKDSLTRGYMHARVLDPMDSGLMEGDEILVCDPYKRFLFTPIGASGIAFMGQISVNENGFPINDQYGQMNITNPGWVIEQCDQLVVRVKATMTEGLAPWAINNNNAIVMQDMTAVESESYWPYIISDWGQEEGEEGTGDVIPGDLVVNPHRFTANPGYVWMERREKMADSSTMVGPMDYPEIGVDPEYEWVIVDVEKPTARYIEVMKGNDSDWLMNGGLFWEGEDPEDNDKINGAEIPAPFNEGHATWCAIPAGTKGVAFLDDNSGYYVVISTMSALYGPGTLSDIIGTEATGSVGDPLMYSDPNECQRLKYKRWENVVVFGNKAGGNCQLDHMTPDPYVDLETEGYDKQVVTGIQVNAQGELEFTTTTVKVCEEVDGTAPIQNTSITYLDDVNCSVNEFQQSYKTVNIIGNQVASGQNTIDASCIQDQFDWEYIFNNYVYNEDWYTINYYDITYPEGCEPCPTGCCTYVDENGDTVYADGITQEACENSGNYQDGTWSEDPCPCNCCKTTDGTGFVEYQTGLTAEECAALVTDPPTGSGTDIVSAECISECPPEPTGCCEVAPDDFRPDKTQAECVTGLGGFWMGENSTCPPVGCCLITFTDGSTTEVVTTQARCESYEDGTYDDIDVDTADYQGDGTTCDGCTGSDCCCGSIQDIIIEVNCMPGPGQPGGGGGSTVSSYTFTMNGGGEGDGTCTWTVDGDWDLDGTITQGSLTVTHLGGATFSVFGNAPNGESVTGTVPPGNGNVTIAGCTGDMQLTHDDETACQNE